MTYQQTNAFAILGEMDTQSGEENLGDESPDQTETDVQIINPPDSKRPWFTAKPLREITQLHVWLATASGCLLSALRAEPELTAAYAITHRLGSSELVLRFKSTAWYDVYLQQESLDDRIATANDFISHTRATEFHGQTFSERDFSLSPKKQKNARVTVKCPKNVTLIDGKQLPCPHVLSSGILLDQHKLLSGTQLQSQYHVGLRNNPVREIVVSPIVHISNQEMVTDANAWKALLTTSELLKARRVAFHFGEWESLQFANPLITNCHAHAHLLFSPEDWDNLANSDYLDEYGKKQIEHGRKPPPNFALKDTYELENQRLNHDRSRRNDQSFLILQKETKDLRNDITTGFNELKNELKVLLQQLVINTTKN